MPLSTTTATISENYDRAFGSIRMPEDNDSDYILFVKVEAFNDDGMLYSAQDRDEYGEPLRRRQIFSRAYSRALSIAGAEHMYEYMQRTRNQMWIRRWVAIGEDDHLLAQASLCERYIAEEFLRRSFRYGSNAFVLTDAEIENIPLPSTDREIERLYADDNGKWKEDHAPDLAAPR